MFSGVGGFELGLLASGVDFKLVGFCEDNKYASQILEKRFKGVKNYDDATKLVSKELPDFDLLVGGSPCPSFSIAGRGLGFKDKRGTLFFEYTRILGDKKPKHFIFENVRGLLSNDEGRTFQKVLEVFTDLGYDCEWELLNSKNFGVPQNRERVYILGHLRGTSRPKVFPVRREGDQATGEISLKEITKDVAQAQRVYDTDGTSVNLKAEGGGDGGKTGLYQVEVPEATKKGYTTAEEGDSINLAYIDSKTRRGRVGKKVAQTLDQGTQYTIQTGVVKNRGEIKERNQSTCIDANYWKGLDNHGERTGVLEEPYAIQQSDIRHSGKLKKRKIVGTLTGQNKQGDTETNVVVKSVAYRTRTYAGRGGEIEERKDNVSNAINSAPKDSMVSGNFKPLQPDGIGRAIRKGGKDTPTNKHNWNLVQAKTRIRRLTPRECERLQGFPDGWTEGLSDTQRYKCMGNAVTTNVVTAIAKRLFKGEK